MSKEMSLQQIHMVELEILQEIDAICGKLGSRYWAMYGTLLGAIRHEGFIPWDDDLDIAMPRRDYELFLEYMKTRYIGGLELHHCLEKDDYPFYIARVVEKKHKLIFDDYEYTSGVFIDIYPIDGMGNEKDRIFWKNKEKEIYRLKKCMELSTRRTFFAGTNIVHKILNIPLKMKSMIMGRNYYYTKIDRLSKTFNWKDSRYVGFPVWGNEQPFLEKKIFDETIRVKFEDITICIPSGYEELLTDIYGDYNQLPPKERQCPSHGYKAYIL